MRLDKLLFCLRFSPSRSDAQRWIDAGHIRVNRRPVNRCSVAIRPGDVLTLPLRSGVAVIEVLAVPQRRGPPSEARLCYRALDGTGAMPIAAVEDHLPEGSALP